MLNNIKKRIVLSLSFISFMASISCYSIGWDRTSNHIPNSQQATTPNLDQEGQELVNTVIDLYLRFTGLYSGDSPTGMRNLFTRVLRSGISYFSNLHLDLYPAEWQSLITDADRFHTRLNNYLTHHPIIR